MAFAVLYEEVDDYFDWEADDLGFGTDELDEEIADYYDSEEYWIEQEASSTIASADAALRERSHGFPID